MLAHELAHAQVPALEQRLRTFEPLTGHHVLVAENLLTHSTDQSCFVVRRGGHPVFVDAVVDVTLDAQVGSVGEGHGATGSRLGRLAWEGVPKEKTHRTATSAVGARAGSYGA